MELAGSDLEFGPASKQRSRKSVSVPPSPRTEIDAMCRRNRCHGATCESNILRGPQGVRGVAGPSTLRRQISV
jgi:hypothetical protein